MSALWTSAEIEAATLGIASAPFEAFGVSIDTRSLKPGDLFVALQGDHRDGHAFVQSAMADGAAGALVARAEPNIGPVVVVGHTQRGLEDLALAARNRSQAKVIAVTGSAGKTTTKEMLRHACGAIAMTHASAASYNNHWGVPLTLAQMPRQCRYAVIEIGMNHFGEIRNLVRLTKPDVALITTIAPAHLEFFGTIEAIADAKAEIFEGLKPGGIAIVPDVSPFAPRLRKRAAQCGVSRLYSFGLDPDCDGRLLSANACGDGQEINVTILGHHLTARLAASGDHIAMNAVAALLAVGSIGGDIEIAATGLEKFSALKGRGARFEIGGISVIDESYNANPASMAAALTVLGAAKGRRIAVLGDMLEMGSEGPALHAALLPAIETAKIDLVFACGPHMQALWDVLPASRRGGWAISASALTELLLPKLTHGDVVLVKGSLGSKMAVVIDALKTMAE